MRHLSLSLSLPLSLLAAAACAGPSPSGVVLSGLRPIPPRAPRTGPVTAAVVPAAVLADIAEHTQRVSCDLRFHNTASVPQELEAITVEALDRAGAIVARGRFDGHGVRPAIATLPSRTVPAGGELYVFNPLDRFPEVDIAALWFRFDFAGGGEGSVTELRVPVRRHRPAARLHVPLAGNVLVAAGHELHEPHRRIDLLHPFIRAVGLRANGARYALDLTRVDERGRMFSGDGTSVEQWHGFGADVLAPADATVIASVDSIPDNRLTPRGVEYAVDVAAPAAIFGNFVLLDLGRGEVMLFAHLARGSIRVRPGSRVLAGDRLARIGFSGNVDFVHTHVQLVAAATADSMAILGASEGLPIYFRDFVRVRGSHAEEVREDGVTTGDVIRRGIGR